MTDHQSTKYQLRIPITLKAAIEQAAATTSKTPSQLVRDAIVAYLDLEPSRARMQPPPIPTKEKAKRANDKRKIALKALKHLQRTNPKLLEELANKMERTA